MYEFKSTHYNNNKKNNTNKHKINTQNEFYTSIQSN